MAIRNGCEVFEQGRVEKAELKRAIRKQDTNFLPVNFQDGFTCGTCNCLFLSRAGLASHQRAQERRQDQSDYSNVLRPRSQNTTCPMCSKVCKSAGGLKRHLKVHKDALSGLAQNPSLTCHICRRVYKSEAGLLSHMRAHGRTRESNNDI